MIQPREMKETHPIALHDGADQNPRLLTCQYDYTAPLHLAVREGHLKLVVFLIDRGALDPSYKTHPFLDSLMTVAGDRGFEDVKQVLPAKDGDHHLLEILLAHGARCPAVSKWGARYYFKNYLTARFLREHGMNPDHMNWREFTSLHDMAHTGDVAKARLLIEHGADVNRIDDEYRSTPLGYAARWGQVEVVKLLLDCGADPEKSGASWSTPLAWAQKKNHDEVVNVLQSGERQH